MSKRAISLRRIAPADLGSTESLSEARPLATDVGELDAAPEIALPRDHPRWARDRFTVSAATKALVDRIKPLALRVFGFWDHRVHRLTLDDATIGVDACGSYRRD
jgi:hypothetical protein